MHWLTLCIRVSEQWFEGHLDTMNRNFHNALEERDERAKKKLSILGTLEYYILYVLFDQSDLIL